MDLRRNDYRWYLVCCVIFAASACSWNPPQPGASPGHDSANSSWSAPRNAVAGSAAGTRVVDLAEQMVGVPYVWGGASPKGFDCSGLVFYAYSETGLFIPRTSLEQFRAARPVALDSAQPGDLVFFRIGSDVSHVGIYVGDNRFIHSPETGQSVKITSLDHQFYRKHFAGAGRIY